MKQFQLYEDCIVCGSSDSTVLVSREQLAAESNYRDFFFRKVFRPGTPDYIMKDHIYFTHTYAAHLVVCKNCGLVCRNPRLSSKSAIHEYTQDEYHLEWLEASFQAYYSAFLPKMPELARKIGNKPRALEIGSHVGGFLAASQCYGWDVQGVDIGYSVSAFARSKGLNVLSKTLMEAQFPDSSFDAVFVWVCFDQLPDPWIDLAEIHRVLSNNGWLILKVPNGDFIKLIHRITGVVQWQPIRKYIWNFLAYAILLAFPFQLGYTPSTLCYILKQSGFHNIQIRNQIYIPVTNPKYVSPAVIHEEIGYLKLAHFVSELTYQLSAHRVLIGPWIEVLCRKGAKP